MASARACVAALGGEGVGDEWGVEWEGRMGWVNRKVVGDKGSQKLSGHQAPNNGLT